MQSAEHIATAEELGYDRAWLFDAPYESPDVWMLLALAAERTTTIGLGPGVLVPTLRDPADKLGRRANPLVGRQRQPVDQLPGPRRQ